MAEVQPIKAESKTLGKSKRQLYYNKAFGEKKTGPNIASLRPDSDLLNVTDFEC